MCVITGAMIAAAGMAAAGSTAATVIAVGANLAIVAAGMSAYSSYQQGQSQKKQYAYQAAVAENNAKVAEWNAQDSIERGEIAEKQHRLKVSQIQGKQRSALASGGVEVDSGSALDVLEDTAYFGEMDALTIRSNSQREAYKYKVNAQNKQAQAGLYRMTGNDAARAGKINAVSSLLSDASSGATTYGALMT
jgi:hypothetical protein